MNKRDEVIEMFTDFLSSLLFISKCFICKTSIYLKEDIFSSAEQYMYCLELTVKYKSA